MAAGATAHFLCGGMEKSGKFAGGPDAGGDGDAAMGHGASETGGG
jgi:hypothetical protein